MPCYAVFIVFCLRREEKETSRKKEYERKRKKEKSFKDRTEEGCGEKKEWRTC